MFTTGTQFDVTEEGVEALQDLRESDLYGLPSSTKLDYLILTALDMQYLIDYEFVLGVSPREASQSNVSDALGRLEKKGWITIEE